MALLARSEAGTTNRRGCTWLSRCAVMSRNRLVVVWRLDLRWSSRLDLLGAVTMKLKATLTAVVVAIGLASVMHVAGATASRSVHPSVEGRPFAPSRTPHPRSVTVWVGPGNYPARSAVGRVRAPDGFSACARRVPVWVHDPRGPVVGGGGRTDLQGRYWLTFRGLHRFGIQVIARFVRRDGQACAWAVGHN